MMFKKKNLKINQLIPACGGIALRVQKGDFIKIIDVEGEQVADFTAVNADENSEYLSAGVTIDVNSSLRLNSGALLYSSGYSPMFKMVDDTVGSHDLIHPMCSTDMYAFQYGISGYHPSCCTNIKEAYLVQGVEIGDMPVPLNVFMNTIISQNGDFQVEKPKSKPGDFILIQALMDVVIAIAACSVQESKCNGFGCSPIRVQVGG